MCGGIYEEEMHSDPMQDEQEVNSLKQEELGMIKVTRLEENEDGSANLEIETDREATRFLIEQGLIALLEKCIDRENKEYALSPELQAGVDENEAE